MCVCLLAVVLHMEKGRRSLGGLDQGHGHALEFEHGLVQGGCDGVCADASYTGSRQSKGHQGGAMQMQQPAAPAETIGVGAGEAAAAVMAAEPADTNVFQEGGARELAVSMQAAPPRCPAASEPASDKQSGQYCSHEGSHDGTAPGPGIGGSHGGRAEGC
jgi:hypothetical protein